MSNIPLNQTTVNLRLDPNEELASLRAENELLKAERSVLANGINAVAELMDESRGVDGLHRNGDVAPWGELREGGRFEAWLIDFDIALEALSATSGESE